MTPLLSPGLATPLAAVAVVSAVIAALWLAWRAGQRRERARRRERSRLWRESLAAFLARELDGKGLRAAAHGVPPDVFWDAIAEIGLKRRERRRLGGALAHWRPARAERFAIRDDDPVRAELAALRLGLVCSRSARRALRIAVRRAPEGVAALAALSLARAGDAWTLRYLLAHTEVTARRTPRFRYALLRAFGPRACPALQGALEDPSLDPGLARACLEVLGARGFREAAGEIVRRVRDTEPEVRVAAVRAVGALGLHEHALSLKAALDDPAWPVRAQAARSLGVLRPERCEDALAAKLTDSAWWVRRHAAYALANLGRPGIAKLQEIVERSPDRYAREIAKEAMDGGFLELSA